jgi:hypothetical protein
VSRSSASAVTARPAGSSSRWGSPPDARRSIDRLSAAFSSPGSSSTEAEAR